MHQTIRDVRAVSCTNGCRCQVCTNGSWTNNVQHHVGNYDRGNPFNIFQLLIELHTHTDGSKSPIRSTHFASKLPNQITFHLQSWIRKIPYANTEGNIPANRDMNKKIKNLLIGQQILAHTNLRNLTYKNLKHWLHHVLETVPWEAWSWTKVNQGGEQCHYRHTQ